MRKLTASVMILLAGCTTVGGGFAEIPTARLLTNPFDTIADRPDVLNTAATTGKIDVTGQCVGLARDGVSLTLLWPEGTKYELEGSSLFIVLPDNRGRAVVGKTITLTGSTLHSAGEKQLPDPYRAVCASPFFTVSSAY